MKESPHSVWLQRSIGKVSRRQNPPQWKAMLSNNHGSQKTGGENTVRGTMPTLGDCRAQRIAAGADNSSTVYKRLCGQERASER